jgi:hypothetical protein
VLKITCGSMNFPRCCIMFPRVDSGACDHDRAAWLTVFH